MNRLYSDYKSNDINYIPNKSRRTTTTRRVKNSLDSDVPFVWPMPNLTEHEKRMISENFTSSCSSVNDDTAVLTDNSGSTTSGSDDDTSISSSNFESSAENMNNTLFSELLSEDGSLDFPCDIFQTYKDDDKSKRAGREVCALQGQDEYVDATAMMGQECVDYFMAEYLKSPSRDQMSFADFVTVTLDMIAAFSKVKTNSNEKAMMKEVSFDNENADSSFDFSIRNWQEKVSSAPIKSIETVSHCSQKSDELFAPSDVESFWHSGVFNTDFNIFGDNPCTEVSFI